MRVVIARSISTGQEATALQEVERFANVSDARKFLTAGDLSDGIYTIYSLVEEDIKLQRVQAIRIHLDQGTAYAQRRVRPKAQPKSSKGAK